MEHFQRIKNVGILNNIQHTLLCLQHRLSLEPDGRAFMIPKQLRDDGHEFDLSKLLGGTDSRARREWGVNAVSRLEQLLVSQASRVLVFDDPALGSPDQ